MISKKLAKVQSKCLLAAGLIALLGNMDSITARSGSCGSHRHHNKGAQCSCKCDQAAIATNVDVDLHLLVVIILMEDSIARLRASGALTPEVEAELEALKARISTHSPDSSNPSGE